MKNGAGNGCGTSHIIRSISIPEVPDNFHIEILYNEAPNNSKCCNNYMFAYNSIIQKGLETSKLKRLQIAEGRDCMKRYGDMAWMQSTCYNRHGNNDTSMPCLIT